MNGRETWLQEDGGDGDGETAYVVHGIRRHTEVIRKNRGQPGNIVGGGKVVWAEKCSWLDGGLGRGMGGREGDTGK